MNKLLIFAGTTEGRNLAEFCAKNEIKADVSTATEYGSSLLPEGIGILYGRLNAGEIMALLQKNNYVCVIDATHPYAEEATENIRSACQAQNVCCLRLIRKMLPVVGESVGSLTQMVSLLNQNDDIILSTLGSKSVPALTAVRNYPERIWLRLLPSETIKSYCVRLGFDHKKLLKEQGPFSTEQNLRHIRESCAGILLTKESGTVGGYPEKAEAVKQAGIRMITLRRPSEPVNGLDETEIRQTLLQMKKKRLL